MRPSPRDPAVRDLLAIACENPDDHDHDRAVAALVAATPDPETLEAAHLELLRQMHTGPSDDFEATAALRRILAALAGMPHHYDRRTVGPGPG
jgi:hypothetical protein